MYVCLCECMHACMYSYMYACMHVHVCIYICMYVNINQSVNQNAITVTQSNPLTFLPPKEPCLISMPPPQTSPLISKLKVQADSIII